MSKKKNAPQDRLILAIDPSLSASGWALVKFEGGLITLLGSGEVPTNAKQTHGERLRVIRGTIKAIADGHELTDVVKERGISRFPPQHKRCIRPTEFLKKCSRNTRSSNTPSQRSRRKSAEAARLRRKRSQTVQNAC